MPTRRRTAWTRAAIAVAGLAVASAAHAQGPGPGRGGDGPGWWMGHFTMMGPAMMGRGDWDRSCGPAAAGFGQWRLDRLDQEIKLSDAQRAKFEDMKTASVKAAEQMRAACAQDVPATMPARMTAMATRMEAMLQAIKTVQPSLEGFYATLTDDQKARLEGRRGSGRFWRWMHSW